MPHSADWPHPNVAAGRLTVPDDAATDFQRGLAAYNAGDRRGAFSGFLMALALEPDQPLYRKYALEILGTSGGYASLPVPVVDALAGCADDASLDLQPLALVVKVLLPHGTETPEWTSATCQNNTDLFDEAVEAGLFDGLASTSIIGTVLKHATNVSVALEDILTGIRRHTLNRVASKQPASFLERHREFFDTMCVQAERSDFAWPESDDETNLLEKLTDSRASEDVRRAYRHIETPPARSFPVLTPISDSVSQVVQAQYAAYPYPRWENVPNAEPLALADVMRNRFPDEKWPDRFDGPLSGLSAGCGTGRGAVMLARSIKNLDLTAIDLSPTSLTFAAEKARTFSNKNIKFGLGDILEVGSLNLTFDIIECSGVLHHMHDPATGLRALKDVLAPDGVMRVALYSERARSAVVAARQWVAEQSLADTPIGLRAARAELRALPEDHPAKAVIETPDFFNLSGLHDLIFNVQEHRFTPKSLKHLLDQAGLRFLAFDHFNLDIPNQYAAAFGTDSDPANLDNWETFEQNHPDTFSEMYQMWCRPA